jgi:hypothetical protein
VPDFDPIALAPGAGVFTLLTYLIVKLTMHASADRKEYATRLDAHHADHKVELEQIEVRFSQRLVGCETELRVVRQEIEAARKARYEAEDAKWRAEQQATYWRGRAVDGKDSGDNVG